MRSRAPESGGSHACLGLDPGAEFGLLINTIVVEVLHKRLQRMNHIVDFDTVD